VLTEQPSNWACGGRDCASRASKYSDDAEREHLQVLHLLFLAGQIAESAALQDIRCLLPLREPHAMPSSSGLPRRTQHTPDSAARHRPHDASPRRLVMIKYTTTMTPTTAKPRPMTANGSKGSYPCRK
jgi:hypothetical protein